MRGRLITTIVSTIAEEALFLFVGLWLAPTWGVSIPLPALLTIMVGWLAWSVFTYRKGTYALKRKPVDGLGEMMGMKGTVVKPLAPDGVVRIHGELWGARSETEEIKTGTKVVVIARRGLRLIVRADAGGSPAVSSTRVDK